MTAGLLREALDGVEDFGRNRVLRDYALDHAGAVAKLGEEGVCRFRGG